MEKLRLLEAVVVEGRDDEAAVLRAVDAAVISTHGWGLPEGNVERIRAAYERTGIIILTDPDFAGENIRRRLSEQFPDAKHAYLARPAWRMRRRRRSKRLCWPRERRCRPVLLPKR